MSPPRTSRFLRWGFRRYLLGGVPFGRGFLAKHFHGVRLLEPLEDLPGGKRVFFLNHPGWWDPLAAAALADRLAPDRTPFAPIDAAALAKYPIVGRLGLFGVERDTPAGARAFLTAARAVLGDPAADLWLTPQGTFAPPDERPIAFAPGLGHLLSRDPELAAIPVAVRYDFWTERLPELLLAVGQPVRRVDVRPDACGVAPVKAEECSRFLAGRLEATLDELTAASAGRNPSRFRSLRRGSTGISAGYDAFRRIVALLSGRPYAREHGTREHGAD